MHTDGHQQPEAPTKVAHHDPAHADASALFDPHDAPQLPAPVLPMGVRVRSAFTKAMIWLYLPAIFQGMARTFEYMFRPKSTVQYPEVKHPLSGRQGYRGEHRLKKDEHGHPNCVACFMCATACPAECITIVAAPAPADWVGRDKRPVKFDIDLLKCIYCGMCEEACPCDAIELTPTYTQVSTSRAEKVYNIDRLLRN
ncbi:MAG: NADH-quinone oxidoreductase subunit I [Myxococcota bacterium]